MAPDYRYSICWFAGNLPCQWRFLRLCNWGLQGPSSLCQYLLTSLTSGSGLEKVNAPLETDNPQI
eukprot:5598584-Amphidinium_carterae.1